MTAPLALRPDEGRRFILPTEGHGTLKLGRADTEGTFSCLELVMEAGEGPGAHVHTREHELWYVLEGEFRFLLGEDLVHQPVGGLAFGPKGVPHTFQNISDDVGRLLVITATAGVEDFFLHYDRIASGHYDMAALAGAARVAGIDFIGPPLAVSAPR